ADEVVFLDIWKTEGGDDVMIEVIEARGKQLFIPLTLPAPIQNLHHITQLLNHPPDKLSLNSTPLKHPQLIPQPTHKFPPQSICIPIHTFYHKHTNHYFSTTHPPKKLTDLTLYHSLQQLHHLPPPQLLITTIHHDPIKQPFHIQHLPKIKQLLNIPIIPSPPPPNPQHFLQLFQHTHLSPRLPPTILHHQQTTLPEIKHKIREPGIL
ncbi:HisA/HisF-related TIM barrel protein, partial [Staphylococcus epidermidis]|uniref:HisA/HisF-related TIM barrel protein n=1 Tax=Staphylococcus epidermidis TaxID=1282 RepID=UPI00119DE8D9